jgi:hypothetical protein
MDLTRHVDSEKEEFIIVVSKANNQVWQCSKWSMMSLLWFHQ